MTRKRVAVLTALAVLVAAVVAVVGYVVWPRGSTLERAASLLPAETLRVTWSDWTGLRSELGVSDPVGAAGEDFVTEVIDRDLSVSPLAASAAALRETFGYSPLESEWEILGQGPEGQVDVLKLGEDVDLGEVADRYQEAGFTAPDDDELSGGVWTGGPDVLAELEGLTGPILQHVAFLEDDQLLLTSDSAEYLARAVPVARGEEDGLDLSNVAESVEEPLAASILEGDLACDRLSMSKADPDAQAVADQLIDEAGGVSPLTGFLVALGADRRLTVVWDFENDDQAAQDARSRRALAGAEDPGQFLAYPEVFRIADVEADGDKVVLTGTARAGQAPISNLTTGPVLLAAC
jgi:hypothetical protein